jgi:hypothetical protein
LPDPALHYGIHRATGQDFASAVLGNITIGSYQGRWDHLQYAKCIMRTGMAITILKTDFIFYCLRNK